jgi:hypothetical protein
VFEPLCGGEIVSDASRLDAKRQGSARFFDPKDGSSTSSHFLEDPHATNIRKSRLL